MAEYDERRLEELMRTGLAERARQADTGVDLEVGRAPAGHRWRTPLLAAAGVAVTLLLAVPLLAPSDDGPSPGGEPTTGADGIPAGWRVEVWHGVQVAVPGDWAVGGAPMADGGSAGLVDCGAGAYVDHEIRSGLPYVGRPVTMTDMCVVMDPESPPPPTAPYVWLGSPVPTGQSGWSNGYVASTVEVGGERVTVATDDPALRERILATVATTGRSDPYGCPAVQPAGSRPGGELAGDPERLAVCVYEGPDLDGVLRWSGEQDAAHAAAFLAAVGNPDEGRCESTGEDFGPRVVLYAQGAGGSAGYVVDFGCGRILLPPSGGQGDLSVALTPKTVEPWAGPGVQAYVPGPFSLPGDLTPYFRGILG